MFVFIKVFLAESSKGGPSFSLQIYRDGMKTHEQALVWVEESFLPARRNRLLLRKENEGRVMCPMSPTLDLTIS